MVRHAGCACAVGVLLLGLVAGLAPPAAAQALAGSLVPRSGFYIGIGGSLGPTDFGTQDAYAVGTSSVYRNGALISTGSAAGPGTVSTEADTGFAPSAQIGYFRRFQDSAWLWGAMLSYSYSNATSTVHNLLLPQAGSFTDTGSSTPVPFTGNAYVRTYENRLNHQIMLVPFIGRAFARGTVYAGAGPTLSQTETRLNGLVGFADVIGRPSDISGAPQDFSNSGWVWGAAAVVGATFFLDSSWFIDVRYVHAATGEQKGNYASSFLNAGGVGGTVISGTLVGNTSGSVTTQGITFTINRAF